MANPENVPRTLIEARSLDEVLTAMDDHYRSVADGAAEHEAGA